VTRRLLFGFLSLTLFVVVVLEVPLGITYARREERALRADVEHDAVVLASLAEDRLEHDEPTNLATAVTRYTRNTDARVVVVDDRGTAIVDTEPPSPGVRTFRSRPEIRAALAGHVASGTRHSNTLGGEFLYVAVPVSSSGRVYGAVRVTYPARTMRDRVRRTWLTLAGVAAVSLAAAALIGWVVARSIARPLTRLQAATNALGRGELSARAPTRDGPGEVRSLAEDFNVMAARLEELVEAQDAFVADASHQLRSPLTALRLRLEMLDVGDDDAAGASDVEAAIEEVRRLSRVVDGLLALARVERTPATTQEDVEADALLAERAAAWSALAQERDVELATRAQPGILLRASRDRVVQVLDNLLANAIDAAPPGSAVTLAATARDGVVELHVVDQGPGLTDAERSRAFDRFWRANAAPKALGGSGIGLSIVAKLAHVDGATVELRAASPTGIDATASYRRATVDGSRVVKER
jgi:signal transduction histidine kinase